MTSLTVSPSTNLLALHSDIAVDDIYLSLLRNQHKESTRRSYQTSLKSFAVWLLNKDSLQKGMRINLTQYQVSTVLTEYLRLPKKIAVALFLEFKTRLIELGYLPNTINLKLQALKSLVKLANKLDSCSFILDDCKGLEGENYRDTKGTSVVEIAAILALPDRSTTRGKRDYAILRVLWDLALRRGELVRLNWNDFNERDETLSIVGKGRNRKEKIKLPQQTIAALKDYHQAVGSEPELPMFISFEHKATLWSRLTTDGIYKIVKFYSRLAGGKVLSPHQIRHSAITAILDSSNGNVRRAQALSRHKSLEVLVKYDDNRSQEQETATSSLASMV